MALTVTSTRPASTREGDGAAAAGGPLPAVTHVVESSGPADDETPEVLALRLQQGSEASLGALVQRFEVPLYRFLLLKTGSAADAEELAHDTFVRAWQNIQRYRSDWRFSTWLFTIARRLAATHLRRRRVAFDVPSSLEDPTPGPERATSDREERGNLWRLAMNVLTEDQRTALWLRYVEDLEPREIARILGRSRTAVRVLLLRARRALGRHLDDRGEPLAHGGGRSRSGEQEPSTDASPPASPDDGTGGA